MNMTCLHETNDIALSVASEALSNAKEYAAIDASPFSNSATDLAESI